MYLFFLFFSFVRYLIQQSSPDYGIVLWRNGRQIERCSRHIFWNEYIDSNVFGLCTRLCTSEGWSREKKALHYNAIHYGQSLWGFVYKLLLRSIVLCWKLFFIYFDIPFFTYMVCFLRAPSIDTHIQHSVSGWGSIIIVMLSAPQSGFSKL